MALTVVMQAPSSLANNTAAIGLSGTSYPVDNYGLIKNVSPPDIQGFLNGGFVLLATGGRANLAATSDPTSANDISQDYAIGSRWLNTTARKEFVAISVATGAAVWQSLADSGLPTLVKATGATQGAALLLTAALSILTTCTASARGLRLGAPSTGKRRKLMSNTTQGCKVYPGTGCRFNGTSTNTAKVLAGFKAAEYIGLNTTTWMYNPSA